MALVAWDRIAKPISCGGLGLRDLAVMNNALLLKMVWRLANGSDSLWARQVRAKYMPRSELWLSKRVNRCTGFWRSVMALRPSLQTMVKWSLGDGTTCRVFTQLWFPAALTFAPQVPQDRWQTVSELVDAASGNWDVGKIASLFGYGAAMHIVTHIRPPREGGGTDPLIFSLSSNGKFSVKKAYLEMAGVWNQEKAEGELRKLWSHIWHAGDSPPRIRLFMWKLTNGALPLSQLMSARLGRGDALCPVCGQADEDTVHMVLTCPFARSTWFTGDLSLRTEELTGPIQETLQFMIAQLSEEQWTSLIANCWSVWRSRNACVFQGKVPTREAFLKFRSSILLENLIASAAKRKIPGTPGDRQSTSGALNGSGFGDRVCFTDGSWAFDWIGGAGFLFTNQGSLFAYSTERTTVCCALQAEATALLLVIGFAQSQGFYPCQFLTDCEVLADACTSLHPPMEVDWRAQQEVFQIWKILKGNTDFSVCHISRSHNEVADKLSKRGRLTGESITGYTYPIFYRI